MQDKKETSPPEKVDRVASVIAQRNAMERGVVFLPHGSRLFPVLSGWESIMISREAGVPSCTTLLEFEDALQAPDVKVLFVPKGARMTDQDIEKLCQRNGVTKTIFREMEEA